MIRIATWAAPFVLAAACAKAAPPPACDPQACKAGNECLSDGKTTTCRLVCATQADCPFNYHCAQNAASKKPFCVADAHAYRAGPGVWGAPCKPAGGIDANPDCAAAQGFWCKADSPTDGNAFCTQFLCTGDADCPGGFWCAAINKAPNALETPRSYGETWTACLPRAYCAPCATDLDCPVTPDGARQYCVTDDTGKQKFCASACTTSSNCPLDAACQALDEAKGASACVPRAGWCHGDGSLCAPCLSDADCAHGGFCIQAGFSTERFCGAPSATPCTGGGATGCPAKVASGAQVACITSSTDPDAPKDQCVAVVDVGGTNALGCWSRPR